MITVELDETHFKTLLRKLEEEIRFVSVAAAEATTYKARRGEKFVPTSKTDDDVLKVYDITAVAIMSGPMYLLYQISDMILPNGSKDHPTGDDPTAVQGIQADQALFNQQRRPVKTP